MPTSLDDRISIWESEQQRRTQQAATDTKTLTIKVAPSVVEDLTRIAKSMKVSRSVLAREVFDDGYRKLCKAEQRVGPDSGAPPSKSKTKDAPSDPQAPPPPSEPTGDVASCPDEPPAPAPPPLDGGEAGERDAQPSWEGPIRARA